MDASQISMNNPACPMYLHPDMKGRLKAASSVGMEFPTMNILERNKLSMTGRAAVITVDDVLIPRGGYWWGMPMDALGSLIEKLANDPGVSAIVLDIDSPGGSVFGIQELGDKIVAARSSKPIIGIANPMAASCALWLFSACAKRYVTPGGQVGSHGVIYDHFDYSQLFENAGIGITRFQSSPKKDEFSSDRPLTEDASKRLQSIVDYYHETFTKALAKNYGIPSSKVTRDFGQGRMLLDIEAKSVGMVDGIAPFDQIVDKLAAKQTGGRTMRAGINSSIEKKRLDLRKRSS
jgi:signal peptide peptidase SppA